MDAVTEARDAATNHMIYSNPEWRRMMKGVLEVDRLGPVERGGASVWWALICGALGVVCFVAGILVRGWW